MAEADSPGLSFDFEFTKGPAIQTYVGDITQAKADMLVVPEGVSFKGLGYIGRQMMDLSPNFRKSREKLINEKKNKFAAWETYTSTINSKLFKHVIHSIVVPCPDQNVEEWSNRMHLLYQKIFQEADRKVATVLAVPLLGTGRGGGRLEDVIEAAVNSVVSFKQTNLKRILFVSNDPEIVVQIASRCEWERAHGGQGQKWRALNNESDVSYTHSKARRPSSGKPKTGPISPDFKYLQSASSKTPIPQSAAGRKGHIGGKANEQTTRNQKGSKRETHRTGKDQKPVVSLYIHDERLQSDDNFRGIQKSGYAPETYCSRATKTKNISQQSRAHSHGHGNKPWDQQEEFDEQNGRTFTDTEYRHKHNIIDLQIKHTRQKEDEMNRVKVNHLLLIGNEISGAGGGPKWREHKSEDQEKNRNAMKKVNANFNPSTMDEERRLPQGLSDSDASDGDDVGGDNEKDDSTSTASDEDTWIDTPTVDNVHSSLELDKKRESRYDVVIEGRRKGNTGTQNNSHRTSCGEQLQGRHNLHEYQPKSTTTFHMENNPESSFGHLEIPGSKEPHDDELPGPQSQGARPKDQKYNINYRSKQRIPNENERPMRLDNPGVTIAPVFAELQARKNCIKELETLKAVARKKGLTVNETPDIEQDVFKALSQQLAYVLGKKIEHEQLRTVLAGFMRSCQSDTENNLGNFLIETSLDEVISSIEKGETVDSLFLLNVVSNKFVLEILLIAVSGEEIRFQPFGEKEFLPTLSLGTIGAQNRYFSLELEQDHVFPDIPRTWSRSTNDTELVTLWAESAEFKDVEQSFLSSFGESKNRSVKQIKRVQSTTQWKRYEITREQMAKMYPDRTTERILWH